MTDRYKRFVPHEDNVQEIISADHVNKIQDQVQKNQKEGFRQEDVDFLDRALFVLDNHAVINSLYMDLIEDTSKVDMTVSPGLVFNPEERSISFDDSGAVSATLVGKSYLNPNNTNIKNIIFMASYSAPEGGRINFELSNNGLDFYPVTPGESNVFEFPTTGNRLQVRATFIRTTGAASPILKGYGVLYRDPKYVITLLETSPLSSDGDGGMNLQAVSHNDLTDVGPDDHHPKEHNHDGLDGSGIVSHKHLTDMTEDDHHAKNHQHGMDGVDPVVLDTDVSGTLGLEHLSHILFTGKPGELELIRNPDAYDKLVQVVSPDNHVYLFYDWASEGRLAKVITVHGDIAVEENLNYALYTNSEGASEMVMVGTTKYIKDAVDADIQNHISTVMAPAPTI